MRRCFTECRCQFGITLARNRHFLATPPDSRVAAKHAPVRRETGASAIQRSGLRWLGGRKPGPTPVAGIRTLAAGANLMPRIIHLCRLVLVAALAAAVPLALPASASAQTKMKMVLNWKY